MYNISDEPLDGYNDDELYNAFQVANWFIKRAKRDGRVLSVMSILKLSYIAHGKHLAKYDAPLFKNRIEAWQYGPVIVDIYLAFRKQGVTVYDTLDDWSDIRATSYLHDFLEEVWNKFGRMRPFKLSYLTHVPDGPWDIASRAGGWYVRISDRLIRQHYIAKEAELD